MTLTVTVTVDVEAENEEQATQLANEKFVKNEAFWIHRYDSVLDHETTSVNESEDEDTPLDKALDYVRENLSEEELNLVKAEIDCAYQNHTSPSHFVSNDGKIIDLLEEYGEDNDLPEGWWMEYGDIDDILLKL